MPLIPLRALGIPLPCALGLKAPATLPALPTDDADDVADRADDSAAGVLGVVIIDAALGVPWNSAFFTPSLLLPATR